MMGTKPVTEHSHFPKPLLQILIISLSCSLMLSLSLRQDLTTGLKFSSLLPQPPGILGLIIDMHHHTWLRPQFLQGM
jgi:hypothetical protein